VLLSIFHVFFIMLVWSFVQAMTTDPGQVPVFWGFHLGDPENKRRRYCLMCNIFKPERCHHCSACNRCVLNMDHHCPWINNCIGFWNRKFFILLLIYVLIMTYFNILTMFTAWFDSITWAVDVYYYTKTKNDENIMEKNLILQFAFVMNGIIAVLMTMFLKFHIKLALNNKTTIENLEMKNKTYQSLYDIGPKRNWEQVFGINKLLWPFPVFWRSGKPLGDGIYWPTNRNEGKDPNADSANRNSAGRRQNSVDSPHQNGSFSQPQRKQFNGQMGQNPNA
jgi:palmitoyltransferase ZDHHC2/15/20